MSPSWPWVTQDVELPSGRDDEVSPPAPLLWLLGKSQAGKSSVAAALTQDPQALVGDGTRPCTRQAVRYAFPDAQMPLLHLLDTRGLGEAQADVPAQLAGHIDEADLLLVVVRVMDPAQQPLLDMLETIHRRRAHLPALLVLTCLHEGYPDPQFDHPQPYLFTDPESLSAALSPLAEAIATQRQRFAAHCRHWVAVDLTLEEDGYIPRHYGLETLYARLEQVLPLALWRLLRDAGSELAVASDAQRRRAADTQVLSHALATAAAAAIPVPVLDLPLVGALQGRMATRLAALYGFENGAEVLREVTAALGAALLFQVGRRELVKLLPAYGSAASMLLTAASTYALGRTLQAYYLRLAGGDVPDQALLRSLYAEQFEAGRRKLRECLARS